MNIDNLNKLIAHLEAQPPSAINMGWVLVLERPECGTAGCILGHALLIWPKIRCNADFADLIGVPHGKVGQLTTPDDWSDERDGVYRYPAHRVIATLKRLRDTYLSTGLVVVDWGPEPGEEPKQVWTVPQVAEVINPALPAELTSLLRNTVEA